MVREWQRKVLKAEDPQTAWLSLQVYKELQKELRLPRVVDSVLRRG